MYKWLLWLHIKDDLHLYIGLKNRKHLHFLILTLKINFLSICVCIEILIFFYFSDQFFPTLSCDNLYVNL